MIIYLALIITLLSKVRLLQRQSLRSQLRHMIRRENRAAGHTMAKVDCAVHLIFVIETKRRQTCLLRCTFGCVADSCDSEMQPNGGTA